MPNNPTGAPSPFVSTSENTASLNLTSGDSDLSSGTVLCCTIVSGLGLGPVEMLMLSMLMLLLILLLMLSLSLLLLMVVVLVVACCCMLLVGCGLLNVVVCCCMLLILRRMLCGSDVESRPFHPSTPTSICKKRGWTGENGPTVEKIDSWCRN